MWDGEYGILPRSRGSGTLPLASLFGPMCIQECVKRIESLREGGRLCGVLDDRGRFLCLTEEELQKVAAALKSQGRFSKETDLVNVCNRIIRLTPSEEVIAHDAGYPHVSAFWASHSVSKKEYFVVIVYQYRSIRLLHFPATGGYAGQEANRGGTTHLHGARATSSC